MPEIPTVTVNVADAEPVKQLLAAASDLAKRVEWVLNDALYAAPEAYDRHSRNYAVLREALGEFKATVKAQTNPPGAKPS